MAKRYIFHRLLLILCHSATLQNAVCSNLLQKTTLRVVLCNNYYTQRFDHKLLLQSASYISGIHQIRLMVIRTPVTYLAPASHFDEYQNKAHGSEDSGQANK